MIVVLAGGVGAARLLRGLVEVIDPAEITVIGNVADDFVLHGLHISPDLDTVVATLTDDVGPEGWGRADESWRTMNELDRLAAAAPAPAGSRATGWFRLGDRDLATHLYRTQRLGEGASLSLVTAEIVRAAGLGLCLLPVTDQPMRTHLTLTDGRTVDFQEYFVTLRHEVAVTDVTFIGSNTAEPAPGVLESIVEAERVIIAPSNPVVSIGPLLAVPGVANAVMAARHRVVAVSPIVGGRALKGPADRMMVELGHESSVAGVARLWAPYASTLVIDLEDHDLLAAVEAEGMRAVCTTTVMDGSERSQGLADDLMHLPLA